MSDYSERTRVLVDQLDPRRVAALHNVLGQTGDPPTVGDKLPTFWHHIFFWDAVPGSELGRDGHPKPGEFIPDLGLPRRMWASGRFSCASRLVIGREASKTSVIDSVAKKSGRSGELAFVTLRHEYRQQNKVALTEFQNLVYRPAAKPTNGSSVSPAAPEGETASFAEVFDPAMLFRFSALTFNSHRIHYDADYCRETEGYPGLVVHGPLICLRLVQLAEIVTGPFAEFEYRATAPLFCGEEATFCAKCEGEALSLWVRGPGGRQCMTAISR